MVIKLPRESGKRESRYAHLFSGIAEASAWQLTEPGVKHINLSDRDRIAKLEKQVEELQQSVAELRHKLEQLAGVSD